MLRKLLILSLLLLPSLTLAQDVSVRYQSQVIGSRGLPLANQNVAVCTQPAVTTTQPCSPLATLATSTSTTSGGANPLTTDSLGNFFFYAPSGKYTVQVYGPQVGTPFVQADTILSCSPTGNCTYSGANVFTGPINLTGVGSAAVQTALNSLVAGQSYILPCGTYTAPATIPNAVRLIGCGNIPVAQLTSLGGMITYGAPNLTILQASSGVTISNAANVFIDNIVFDMQNNGTNMVLSSVSRSEFPHMAVVNCGTTNPCLTLTTANAATSNTALNSFGDLILQGGTVGLDLTTPTAGTSFVTENFFSYIMVWFPSTTGVLFDKWCDSNTFMKIQVSYFGNVNGLVLNGNTTTAQGVQDEYVSWFDTTGSGITTAKALTVNPSVQNYIRLGILQGYGTANSYTTNNPATIPTTIALDDVSGQVNPNTIQSMYWPQFIANVTASGQVPKFALAVGQAQKWQFYDGGSDALFVDNASNQHQMAFSQGQGTGLLLYNSSNNSTTIIPPSGAAAPNITLPAVTGTLPVIIASGTAAMTTAAITAGNCGTTVTVSASGVLTTDTITWAFNAAPAGSNAGIVAWPTANNVNFAYCSNTAQTPAAATINWKVEGLR